MPAHSPNIPAIKMDRNRWLIWYCIRHNVDVSQTWRDSLYHAWSQARRFSGGQSSSIRLASVWHGFLNPAQHTDKAPHQVVVHRCSLPRTPHEADEAEAVEWVTIQQVLSIAGRVRGGEGLRKPVIMRHQGRE